MPGGYPGIEIAGWRDGYFTAAQHRRWCGRWPSARADVLFLGMPSPFKDIWCERHRDAFGVKLIMGVGGAFDVLAGEVPRAPRWMQAAGLEWAWRLWLEPRRPGSAIWSGNSRFLWLVTRDWARRWALQWAVVLLVMVPLYGGWWGRRD